MKRLLYPFLWILYFLSGLVPRNKDLWVFGSYADSFVDNSKFLFLARERSQHTRSKKFVWITGSDQTVEIVRSFGGVAYRRWSPRGIYAALRAQIHFYSAYSGDTNHWLSGNATRVNLWHGIPLKKIEFDITSGPLAHIYSPKNNLHKLILAIFYPTNYAKPDYLLTPSSAVAQASFKSAFRIGEKELLAFGYPRNDILRRSAESFLVDHKRNTLLSELIVGARHYRHVFIYMPTWRNGARDFLESSGIDFEALSKLMKEHDSLFLLKLHPNIATTRFSSEGLPNVALLDSRVDIYPLLRFTSKLITDYSSIFFDYLLLDKPIVFYPFDKSDYINGDRGLYFDYSTIIPGPEASDFRELSRLIFEDESDFYREKRRGISKAIWEHNQDDNAKKILDYFSTTAIR